MRAHGSTGQLPPGRLLNSRDLTAVRLERTIKTVMLRRLRHHARLTASASLVAMAFVVSATCVSAAQMTPEQHACCEAMQHDCGKAAVEMSCCGGKADQDRSLAAAKPTATPAPTAVLVAILATVYEPSSVESRTWVLDTPSPSPPGVPTYLFVSSFRI